MTKPPLLRFRVTLGARFWVDVYLWERITDAPEADGTEAAYLLKTPELPRKLGSLHMTSRWCDTGTITHEAYHVAAELRRRVCDDSDHDEEWCARQAERFVKKVQKGLGHV